MLEMRFRSGQKSLLRFVALNPDTRQLTLPPLPVSVPLSLRT